MRPVVLLCLLALAAAVQQPRRRMTAAYQRAVAHYQAGRWKQAAAELRSAYAEHHAAGLLYDEAVCQERLGQRRRAAQLYARYLVESVAPYDRRQVEQRVTALTLGLDGEPFEPLGVLLVDSDPPGARVYLDDRAGAPMGVTPWTGHLEGEHTVIVARDGFADVYRPLRPEARAVTVVHVELAPLP